MSRKVAITALLIIALIFTLPSLSEIVSRMGSSAMLTIAVYIVMFVLLLGVSGRIVK